MLDVASLWGRGNRRGVVLGAVAVALAAAGIIISLVMLLGGGSSGQTADAVPAGGLLRTDRLPGGGWTAHDEALERAAAGGEELVSGAPPAAECQGVRTLERTLAGEDAAFVSGESRSVERREAGRLVVSVTHTRLVFTSAEASTTAASGLAAATRGEEFAGCLALSAAGFGTDVRVEPASPAAPPPSGGGAVAFVFTAAGTGAGHVAEHIYWWGTGKELSTLVIATWGSEGDVPAILAEASR